MAISSMNFNFGGKGGKKIRDSELSEDSAGDDDVPALMYETIVEGLCLVWSLTMPPAKEGVRVKVHDYRVRAGDSQSMSFAAVSKHMLCTQLGIVWMIIRQLGFHSFHPHASLPKYLLRAFSFLCVSKNRFELFSFQCLFLHTLLIKVWLIIPWSVQIIPWWPRVFFRCCK